MKLSKLAEIMASDLCIFEDGHSIQDFIYALEDGDVCSQLLNWGYSQEDIEKVHDELVYKNDNF